MSDTLICSYCRAELDEEDAYFFDGECMCSDCYDDRAPECEHCGTRIWYSDNAGDNEIYLCHDCRDAYVECEDCGRLVNYDDSYQDDNDCYYCRNCYDRLCSGRKIHDYNYKPVPVFYGEGKRFFGVELEIDKGGEESDNAEILLGVANSDKEYK